ncbi:AAA family ATPase [Sporolactobacillus shoreicorticis]|uniref:AAA family ATPase n=1 Tax=Sporolactobacillus shoreicorticis TaxID=1923877 RepID=A0ABW5S3G2_9BACL|nr:AAA family ATPase [Sporolactobacillus shoreicorticis]MCO7124369.1 AAA family ATPase [Sporolactobacillus shoreicorticis]
MACIIWINGTFGSGKTTTAHELNKCLPDSFVYDPEYFGYALMKNTPKMLAKSNFQSDPEWAPIVAQHLARIAQSYTGVLIVPMTLMNEALYDLRPNHWQTAEKSAPRTALYPHAQERDAAETIAQPSGRTTFLGVQPGRGLP